ncbi:MAG: hypothetical protein M3Y07_12250, partial [Acidobacteriota bacterium]|nr:hypothetical protein [Acidobacteriota bacterium]
MQEILNLNSQRLPTCTSLLAIVIFACPFLTKASSLTEQSSQLPMFFVENRGQMDPRVRFVMKRSGLTAYFLDAEILLSISGRSLP